MALRIADCTRTCNELTRTKQIDDCPCELLSLGYAGILLGINSHSEALVEARQLQRRRNDQGGIEVKLQQRQDGNRITSQLELSPGFGVVAEMSLLVPEILIAVGGGGQPRWARDGRKLFDLAPDGTMMVVAPDGSARARPLFTTSLSPPSHQLSEYDVTLDGQLFLVLEPASARPQNFTFLLNWIDALNK